MGLNPLPNEPYKMSDVAGKLHASINAQIAKLIDDAARYAASTAELARLPADQLSPDHVERIKAGSFESFDLLRRELAIRRRMASEWFPARTRERSVESQRAFEKLQDAREQVKARLRSAGFVDAFPSGMIGITPDMVARHPLVLECNEWHRTTDTIRHHTEDSQANDQAIGQIERGLESSRARLTRV